MTKSPIPLHVEDLTAFTRALSQQLGETSPSHLTLMNMLARAAGFQNVQHMRADAAAAKRVSNAPAPQLPDARSVEKVLHQFDELGRLMQWPSKRSVQNLALWALWAMLPPNTALPEKAVNARLNDEHLFKDPATLRRTMIAAGLLTRQTDGTNYRRIEQEPPAEAKAVIKTLGARRRARNAQEVANA